MNNESQRRPHPETEANLAQDLVDLINTAITPTAGIRLAALYNERGAAAIAFTRLPDSNIEDEHLREAFESSYLASYPDRESFIASQLDSQDWAESTARHIEAEGIPVEFLVWDHDAIWRRLNDMYDVVEYGGHIHVFWP